MKYLKGLYPKGYNIRKEEKDVLLLSTGIIVVCLIAYYSPCVGNASKNLWLAGLGLALGIIGAVCTSVYNRYSIQKQFKEKFNIEGTYFKMDATGKPESHKNGDEKIAVIIHRQGLTYELHNQYSDNGHIMVAVGTLTFNDDISGAGEGSYKYIKKENAGLYELIANNNGGTVTIWIRVQNIYPQSDFNCTYLLRKKNDSVDTNPVYSNAG